MPQCWAVGDDVQEATVTEGYCQSHTTGERKNPGTIQVYVVTGRGRLPLLNHVIWGFGDRIGARKAQRLRAAKFFTRAKVRALGQESRVLILVWMCVALGFATLSVCQSPSCK